MTICPLCLTLYLGAMRCERPGCGGTQTDWLCYCGTEWQPPADWSRHEIHVDIGGVTIVHRLMGRCGPLLVTDSRSVHPHPTYD